MSTDDTTPIVDPPNESTPNAVDTVVNGDAEAGDESAQATPRRRACRICDELLAVPHQRYCIHCGAAIPQGIQLDGTQKRVLAGVASFLAVVGIIVLATSGGSNDFDSAAASRQVDTETPTTEFEVSTPSTTSSGTEIDNSELSAGDCFAFVGQPTAVSTAQPKTRVDTIPCEQPHPFETVATYTYEAATDAVFPGEDVVEQYARSSCQSPYEEYVSDTPLDLSSSFYFPSSTSWQSGDRTIVCAAHKSSDELLSGRIQDVRSTPYTSPEPSGSGSGGYYLVLSGINIRTGPGTTYSSVGSVAANDQVYVTCTEEGETIQGNSNWDLIRTGPGDSGYVADAYVDTGSDIYDSSVIPPC